MFPPAKLPLSLLALALAAAFAPAYAEETVEASVTVGAGFVVSGDRADRTVAGQYSGLKPGSNVWGIAGGEYRRHDEDQATTFKLDASDLFTGNRELGVRWRKSGDWSIGATWREITRYETAVANTGLAGGNTATPSLAVVAPGLGGDMDLKLHRTALGIDFSKVISPRLQFDASVSSERKEGSRLSGTGFNCGTPIAPGCRGSTGTETGGVVLFMPEPIDSRHTQAEGRLTYAAEGWRITSGIYASNYSNAFGSITPSVPGSLYNPLGALLPLSTGLRPVLALPVALPPDNQAWQFDVGGSYDLSQKTHLNFKLAYAQATQNQNFAASGFTGPTGFNDLGGKVTTTRAQVGITSRPMPKLNLAATVRYEDRNDATPLGPYDLEGTTAYTNRRLPRNSLHAKAEAGWQFTSDWRGTIAVDQENIDRGVFTPTAEFSGVTAIRQKTDETGVRAELRRRMSDTLNGAVSVESRRRTGSTWLLDTSTGGVTPVTDPVAAGSFYSNGIFPFTMADRNRDKVKVSADWQAREDLALQASAETGRDRYGSPSGYGLSRGTLSAVSLDATYTINSKWNLTGFAAWENQKIDQSRADAAIMAFDGNTAHIGIGVTGKPMGNLEVGGNLSFMNDKGSYNQSLQATAGGEAAALLAATGGLPDIVYRQTALKFFGKYTLDKQSSIRGDLVLQHTHWSDWAWAYGATPFVYSDGTTLLRKPNQSLAFIGVTYTRRWP